MLFFSIYYLFAYHIEKLLFFPSIICLPWLFAIPVPYWSDSVLNVSCQLFSAYTFCNVALCFFFWTTDLFHHKRESTVEKGRTLGTVERGHIRDLHPIMAHGAGVNPQLGARAEAGVLTLKSTLGNQMETGLLVSDQLETVHSYASLLLDLFCTFCQV